jgi:hypothetical protein
MIRDKPWERCMGFPDAASATVAASYLEQNGVPSRVEAGSPGVDLSPVAYVLVQGQLAHRARWLWGQRPDMTDAELHFLATGKLDGDGSGQ